MTREQEQSRVTRLIRQEAWRLNESDLEDGNRWYREAGLWCRMTPLARKDANPHLTIAGVAGAVAILSPLQPWYRNLEMVWKLAGDRNAAPQTFHKWWRKAKSCLWDTSADIDQLATGPKVRPFWRALLGDVDAVVVDRWIVRLAYPDDRGYPARIRRLQNAITTVAEERGVYPRDLQAALWLKVRGD